MNFKDLKPGTRDALRAFHAKFGGGTKSTADVKILSSLASASHKETSGGIARRTRPSPRRIPKR